MKVISDGSAFMIDTKHGIISTPLSYSDITPSNTTQLLHPEQVLDTHLSVRTAAQRDVGGPTPNSCKCKTRCNTNRCICFKRKVKCSSKCHNQWRGYGGAWGVQGTPKFFQFTNLTYYTFSSGHICGVYSRGVIPYFEHEYVVP